MREECRPTTATGKVWRVGQGWEKMLYFVVAKMCLLKLKSTKEVFNIQEAWQFPHMLTSHIPVKFNSDSIIFSPYIYVPNCRKKKKESCFLTHFIIKL